MKFHYYDIVDNKIDKYHGEVAGIFSDLHKYNGMSFGEAEIYYKTANGKITEVICQAFSESSARKAVNSLLDSVSIQ